MIYDLIVIGSGAVGAAAGYYAGQEDLDILMIDKHHPPHQFAAHHGRQQQLNFVNPNADHHLPLLQRSQFLWQQLEQYFEEPLLSTCGLLSLAPRTRSQWQPSQQNSDTTEMLTAEQITARWPELKVTEDYQGSFDPQAAIVDSEQIIKFWIEQARQRGVGQLFNCPVTAIDKAEGIYQVSTADGVYQAKRILICAGAGVRELLPQLPVQGVRKVYSWFQADGRYAIRNQFPALSLQLADGSLYRGYPAVNDEFKLIKETDPQPLAPTEIPAAFGACPGDASQYFALLRQFVPGIGGCLYGQVARVAQTSDGDFIIDRLTDDPNCLVVAGLNGEGLKYAPLLGELATQFAQEGSLPPMFAGFSLQRFTQG